MTRAVFFRPPVRPALATLAVLACVAVTLPLTRNAAPQDGTVAARPGAVSELRPIDRILRGEALGSRRLTPAAAPTPAPARVEPVAPAPAPVVAEVRPPRIVAPSPSSLAPPRRLDRTPDPRLARLSILAALPPAPPAPVSQAIAPFPVPRAKPVRAPEQEAAPLPEPVTLPAPLLAALPEAVEEAAPATPPSPRIEKATPAKRTPRIAIVVTAAGLHGPTTRQAIEALPGAVTLAFAPIGRDTATLAKAAASDGHAVLAEIPMEPMNPRRDPGEPLTLRAGNSSVDNIARLGKALARVPGATGISSYLGAKFSRSEAAAAPVIEEVATRGLFLFENQPGAQSRLRPLAQARAVPYVAGSLALDVDRDAGRLRQRLAALEERARREGIAIGVATAYRETVTALDEWIDEARERGIEFVPVTEMGRTG